MTGEQQVLRVGYAVCALESFFAGVAGQNVLAVLVRGDRPGDVSLDGRRTAGAILWDILGTVLQ